jgi:hypothetical protein
LAGGATTSDADVLEDHVQGRIIADVTKHERVVVCVCSPACAMPIGQADADPLEWISLMPPIAN